MKNILPKAHIFFLISAIVTIGVSVSLSQGFLVLSFLAGAFRFALDEDRDTRWTKHPLFLIPAALFCWYFIAFIAHAVQMDEYSIAKAWNGELKDFFLFFGFLSVVFLPSGNTSRLFKALFWLFLVLVITGIVGGFSSVRLAKLISELYKTSTTYRFTHPLGSVASVPIYISIGLMNTHLTFGGLLQFFSAFAVFRFLKNLSERKWKDASLSGVLLVAYILVVFLNQARSSMIGTGVSLAFAGAHLFFLRKELPTSFLVKGSIAFIGLVLAIGTVLAISPAGKKIIGPLFGKEKHTDSGRTFIWVSTFPLIQEHPLIGTGPGNYNASIDKVRALQSEEYPELAYFYEVTQRGHAHNDYFHLASVFGLPALAIFLSLAGAIIYYIFRSRLPFSKILFFYGLLGFFISGLFQCYFQDDEVVILFWILLGLFVKEEVEPSESGTA